ncbi:MAG: [NiFe]-hydrogenase assembly chaperone HybE [Methylococcales bacterium]|nr:[NiFe]-hydrogenase assembly chaperone HybE [Methylococcales bacterium]MDD5755523.1 [NiFe]-hydrogenase assembly chaperone HybE [Methylococcales bacterium]
MNDITQILENCFKQIQTQRMEGVPILNPKLHVQAVDFRLYQGVWLGVLITPWFMNLLYLRDDDKTAGAKITHRFPAGEFEFVVGYEDALGFYQTCSLYSPMFDFEEQDVAVQTAQAALDALLEIPEPPKISRRDLFRGRFSNRETP